MNGIFNSIFWFISPLPAAFLYNYTLAYLLALKRKKMFSLVISLISFTFSTFCFLCPGLPYRQFLNPIVQYSFLGVCCLLLSKHSLQRRFLAWATIIVVSTLPEPLVFYLCLFLRGEGDPMDYMTLAADPTSTLLIRLTYFILLSIFCFITVQLWDRFIRKAPARVLYITICSFRCPRPSCWSSLIFFWSPMPRTSVLLSTARSWPEPVCSALWRTIFSSAP